MTIWSDLGLPALNFNLFLAGYGVQSINLFDILVRGFVAPPSGTSSLTEPGARSQPNNANPNFASTAAVECEINPGPIPNSIMSDVLRSCTSGPFRKGAPPPRSCHDGAFNTNFEIWREGVTGSGAACSDYAKNFGSAASLAEIVRFDEHENPYRYATSCPILCQTLVITLPEASSTSTSAPLFPVMTGGDFGGWMYLNLNNGGSASYSKSRHSQIWVVVSMYAEGRYSVAFDATMLANGCTAAPPPMQ